MQESNRRRDDIPFPREPAQCARGRRLRPRRRGGEEARRGKGEGGKGCSELGTEIHYERREAGKWDSLGAIITKWTPSPTRRLELSIKVSAESQADPWPEVAAQKPPFFFRHWRGLAGGSHCAGRGNWVECCREWRWIICIFCFWRTASLYFQDGNEIYKAHMKKKRGQIFCGSRKKEKFLRRNSMDVWSRAFHKQLSATINKLICVQKF